MDSSTFHYYDFTLQSPSATAVVFKEYGDYWGSIFYDTRFDDDASTSIYSASPPATGSYRPSEPLSEFVGSSIKGTWKFLIYKNNPSYSGHITSWGLWIETSQPTPTPVPPPTPASFTVVNAQDYNGDGTADIAIYRPSTGLCAIRSISRFYFGGTRDIPIPGDYSGNGTADFAVLRNSNWMWAIRDISRFYFGSSGDRPAIGDFNGDSSCDIGIIKNNGLWAIRGLTRIYFGTAGDIPH